MSESSQGIEQLQLEEKLFKLVKFYISGVIRDEVLNILQEGGGERMNYFSDFVTHCIIGEDASENDICDAKDLYEVPAVTQNWVTLSAKCNKLLPTKGFVPEDMHLFPGIRACLSQLSKADCKALWAMLTFNGGTCQLRLSKGCTHLIITKPEGAKYECAVRHNLMIVTPDWVIDSIRSRSRCEEALYHPSLLTFPKPPSPIPPPSLSGVHGLGRPLGPTDSAYQNPNLSTSQILGFSDDIADSKTSEVDGGIGGAVAASSSNKASLLEQLKQRMPWNQPSSTPSGTLNSGQQKPPVPSQLIVQQQQQQQIAQPQTAQTLQQQQQLHQQLQQFQSVQQQRLSVMGQGGQRTALPGPPQVLQQQQQRVVHQVVQHQQVPGQGGSPWRQAIPQQIQQPGLQLQQQQQIQVQKQQFILREGQPQQQQQYTVTVQREVPGMGAGGQLTWQQQQYHLQQRQQLQQQQQPQQQGPQQAQQMQRQITWTPQAQGPPRHLIQLDPQTHAQLQQMDPQQRSLFIQKIQKQRLFLQRQLQLQQQQRQAAAGQPMVRPQMVPQQQLVIRGQLPPGLTAQQWLQQQRERQAALGQTVVISQQQQLVQGGQLRQQVLVQQQQQNPLRQAPQSQQAQGAPQQRELLVAGPGIAPSQPPGTATTTTWIPQAVEGTVPGQPPQNPAQQQQQQQLHMHLQRQQLRLQQLHMQREAAVAVAAAQKQQIVVGQRMQPQAPPPQGAAPGQVQYAAQVPAVQQAVAQVPILTAQPAVQQSALEDVTAADSFQPSLASQQPVQPSQQQQQQQQALVVNPKTKTALANMLSIRLQSGGGSSSTPPVGQGVPVQEGSAAGQLRLMTAQHHAQQHQPPPGVIAAARPPPGTTPHDPQLLAYQQRRTLGNITNSGGSSPVRPPAMVVTGPGAQHAGGVLPQQSPPVGAVAVAPGVKSPYAQTTAARVAAALAKSVQNPPVAITTQQPQHPRPQFYGHNPNLKLPPDLFLLGCIFVIVDYDRTNPQDILAWRQVIMENGGEVENAYNHRVTHVLCENQKSIAVQQALQDGKRCVSAYWLNDVIVKQQVLPPWQALHFPTPFGDDKPCKNHIFSYSGFEGEERQRVAFMIEAVGAKLTTYFTQHNHVLICRRPDGTKYKKARDWGKPVVNLQWLNEILFGHIGCIQTPDMPKYQQFNLGNPFRIEYSLIPNLMAAWKVPINITQESYDKVKASPTPRRAKQPRLEKNFPNCDSDQENKFDDIEVTNPDPPPEDKRPIVLFSGVIGYELHKKARQLGCMITTSKKDVTHLVMPKLLRTIKLLCCLCTCRYVVSEQWIIDSHAQNRLLDEKLYTLSDPEFERMFECNIARVLEQPNRREFFKGRTFYLTPSIVPSPKSLQEIIECAGGTVERHRRSMKQIAEMNRNGQNYILIAHEKDFHLLQDVLASNISVYNAEFVMSSIMRQELYYNSAF